MVNYKSRDETVETEQPKYNAMDILNSYGADQIIQQKEEPKPEKNELIGGYIKDIMESNKPHRQMINSVLQMKPKDIHILKRATKYFMDNPDELFNEVPEEALEDIASVKNSNDLADMLERDFDETDGGDIGEGNTLIEALADVLHSIPNIQKQLKN